MHPGYKWFRMHLLESQGRISTAITPHPSYLHGPGAWHLYLLTLVCHLATGDTVICMHPVASETPHREHANTSSNA